jgi:hypothetical protein
MRSSMVISSPAEQHLPASCSMPATTCCFRFTGARAVWPNSHAAEPLAGCDHGRDVLLVERAASRALVALVRLLAD